ncbi:hypothetical protein [Bremerella volcania]|uniref:hypothetical protein n=1 Tax=Bremerella volcania TaxID=2527984 RepID=UPI0011A2FDBA|nr:hypothetical protein [Bremerella volcania]
MVIFVVWLPRYPGDNREKAVTATRNVSDSRAHHFWDAEAMLSKRYGRILGLPEGKQFAWDTYMVFDADATWIDTPPTPANWMHQMGGALGRSHPRWLDPDRFKGSLIELLKEPDRNQP